MQTQFGKLLRVGYLGGNVWYPTASHGTCCQQIGRSDNFILVEKSEESRIATLIKYEVLDSDPRELIYYINRVVEFSFNHIIIVGETEYGMIFLDCYGRVFMWDDESPMLWPLGNSPEEVPKQTIKGKMC